MFLEKWAGKLLSWLDGRLYQAERAEYNRAVLKPALTAFNCSTTLKAIRPTPWRLYSQQDELTIKCIALATLIINRENTSFGNWHMQLSKDPAPSNIAAKSPDLEMADPSMQARAASAGRNTRLDGRAGVLSALCSN